MKKTVCFLAMASCFVLGSTLAHAGTEMHHGKMLEKRFKAIDANSDGVVTADEFNAFHTKKFAEWDADGNNQITLDEMKAGHKKMMDGGKHKKSGDAKSKKMSDGKMDSGSDKAHSSDSTAKPKSEAKAASDYRSSCCWSPNSSDAK